MKLSELGIDVVEPATTAQNNCSAIAAGRSRLALENPLRLGAVAPRILASGPECSCSESHTSFSPIACVSCACTSDTT